MAHTHMSFVLNALAASLLFFCFLNSAPAQEKPASDSSVSLLFCGDIMLADGPGKAIARGVDPFAEFANAFRQSDLVIGNLECVIATKGEAVDKPWTFRADLRVIPLLTKYFHAVSLANNHTGDFGDEAFLEQIDLLKDKLPTCGGGKDLAAARVPVILEKNGLRIAVLGYNEFKPRSFAATETSPGVAWSIDEQVIEDIGLARTKYRADLVIPFMHWGYEYEPGANKRQSELSRRMIDAGADVVIGAHPHVTQGYDIYKGKLILYSLGNFVFDGFSEPTAKQGWLLKLQMNKDGLQNWSTIAAQIDDEGIPHLDTKTTTPSGKFPTGDTLPPLPAEATP